MARQKVDLLIVGSGFAGIVAASEFKDTALKVAVVDENLHIGGQLLRKIPEQLGSHNRYHPDYVKRIGFSFIEAAKQNKIEIYNHTRILGIYPDRRVLIERDGKRVEELECGAIIMATGARERFLPFKGWTLPGVYSAGMAQVLMKSSAVLPARKVVVAGSGLFLYSVGYELVKNGAAVPAVYEQSGLIDKVKLMPALLHQMSKVSEGARYMSKLVLNGVGIRYRHRVIEARGNGALESVVVAKVGPDGRVIPGREKIIPTEALAIGYGFVPNVELLQLAGCELQFDPDKGGWIAVTDDRLETCVPSVYAAGEVTGIGGALKSITEGHLAALSVREQIGEVTSKTAEARRSELLRQRRHHMNFVRLFNGLYRIPQGAYEEIPDDTLICRCEDVSMGDIRDAVKMGLTTPGALKVAVRTGMGNCQGRICGPVVADLMAGLTGASQTELQALSVRPPIKPVSVASLIGE
jgi:NADPH-dependent 2,4-dienoyl-CoA reductase/sulfur reductase-like enzyme